MVAVNGIYQNGKIKLDKEYYSDNPVRVIVTFLDDLKQKPDKGLSLADFSFISSQKNLENLKGSLADEVVEERRNEI